VVDDPAGTDGEPQGGHCPEEVIFWSYGYVEVEAEAEAEAEAENYSPALTATPVHQHQQPAAWHVSGE